MFQILVYAILFLSRCDALPRWLFDDIRETSEYFTALYSKYEFDPGARDILDHVTTALKVDFLDKEFAFNHVPNPSENMAVQFWQIKRKKPLHVSNQPPRTKKRFTRAESDLIREIRETLPDPPELIPCELNQPDLEPGQYRNYKLLVVESVILQYAHSINSDHEVAICVDRIKHGLPYLDRYRYIYYESLELSRLFNRVYQKHPKNWIAILVLKLHVGNIDNFIRGASEHLVGPNPRDRLPLITALVNVKWFSFGVIENGKKAITQAEEAVRSVLADVSGGLELFKTEYDNQGVAHYSFSTRNYLEQQRDQIPQLDITSLYPVVKWDPDCQRTFQDLMNRALGVGNHSSV